MEKNPSLESDNIQIVK